jgi:UTP--glucose-1-phosphate uridylyltransferase
MCGAGVNDVLLVTSRDKRALEDHFDRNAGLERRLAAGNKQALLASIDALMAKVRVHAVRQGEQKGLGDAVLHAAEHVGDEPFLCLLGDAIFSGDGPGPAEQLVAAHRRFGGSVIGLEEVPEEKVTRYGIVGGTAIEQGLFKLDTLVEKPTKESAPSRLAIAARYVLSPTVFACLRETKPGAGGEVQLTDALQLLLRREPIHGVILTSRRHDIGNPVDWLRTNLVFARRDAALWAQVAPLARALLDQ